MCNTDSGKMAKRKTSTEKGGQPKRQSLTSRVADIRRAQQDSQAEIPDVSDELLGSASEEEQGGGSNVSTVGLLQETVKDLKKGLEKARTKISKLQETVKKLEQGKAAGEQLNKSFEERLQALEGKVEAFEGISHCKQNVFDLCENVFAETDQEGESSQRQQTVPKGRVDVCKTSARRQKNVRNLTCLFYRF